MSSPAGTIRAEFELVRVAICDEGAFGVLLHGGLPFAVTLERTYPLAGGLQLVKIPIGRFRCVSRFFNRGGYDTYEVTGVQGHQYLLFHVANTEGDLEGCIGVGRRFGPVGERWGIVESRLGFDEFMRRAAGRESFDLVVSERAA